ncbi:MAG: pyridoxamine 5'-phosphate oxidase family protein [Dehalococcoidia bacterium]
MTESQREEFLGERRYGILTTLRHDGRPVSLPVWFDWDGQKVSIFAHHESAKIRRLRRDPRASLLAANFPGEQESWVAFDGSITIKPGGLDVAERLTPRYYLPDDPRRKELDEWRKTPDDWLTLELLPEAIRTHID